VTPERWQQVRETLDQAIALGEAERSPYLDKVCASDPDLRREVESLLLSHERAGSAFLRDPAVDLKAVASSAEVRVGRRIGVYQIVEEIGRGGMGEVYRAFRADGQYDQQVAIKLVRVGLDTASILERFRNERQILAGLDHPNIARLLDGGTTEEGIPYLVMELIAGTPVDDYCDAHSLRITERLQLFRQVCAAVQYAHQRLVIHRDIKPSNILVTEDGIPKLLDFGIAKILDPSVSSEITMVRPMTPEYASPEQIRGEAITTATDVYSLGVVLYRLLTGHSPYRVKTSTSHELVRAISETEPERPSTAILRTDPNGGIAAHPEPALTPNSVSDCREGSPARLRRRLAGDLDNIVLKAVRKEPQRRYASVEQFAEDIRRHLDGLPVIARKDSGSYRAGKFIRRHKVGMAATALVAVAVFGGAAATLREARIAAANERRAERRFNDVRKLANSVLFEIHDAIQDLPGSTPARELVVRRALEYLDGLAREAGDDASLRRELATAYEKVGDVQGSPYRSNLGNLPGALASYRKALQLREQLGGTAAKDPQIQLELARSYGEVGELLYVTGDLTGALEDYRKAFAGLASLTSLEARRELSILHVRYGKALAKSGELAKAVENHQEAIAITDDLLKTNPGDRVLIRAKAFANISLGDAYQDMGQWQKELASQRTAIGLLEPLVEPTNARSRRDVAVAYARSADALSKIGDKRGALAIQLKALAEDERAARIDPTNALPRRDVYIDYYKVAFLQSALGDMRAALANQRKCISLCEAESAANPASAEIRGNLGVAYFRYGEMLEKVSTKRDALQYYQKAVNIEEALSQADPTDTEKRGDLSEDEMKLSDVYLQLGDTASALAGYRKALAIREGLVAANPENAEGRSQLAWLYGKLGRYHALQAVKKLPLAQSAESWREARRWYQQSFDVWKDLQQHKTIAAEYASQPVEVSRQLAKCDAAIAQLP
jgi:serine/threonine protein kinase/tetratricopeptide (TPR) repeat protein